MEIQQAIILSIAQGLTEFLPISSSGHLVFLQKLMRMESPPIFFDILVHLATLIAVIFYFRMEILNFFKSSKNLFLIIIGTLPAVVLGLFLESKLEFIFNSFLFVGFFWLANAGLLFLTKFFKREEKQIAELKWPDAFFVGAFQALALFPGVSRSGATITAGLWRKFDREIAFRFSFFLATPAILGALFLQVLKLQFENLPNLSTCLISSLLAALVGYFSLLVLEKIIKKRKLLYFSFYCFAAGLLSLALSLVFH